MYAQATKAPPSWARSSAREPAGRTDTGVLAALRLVDAVSFPLGPLLTDAASASRSTRARIGPVVRQIQVDRKSARAALEAATNFRWRLRHAVASPSCRVSLR